MLNLYTKFQPDKVMPYGLVKVRCHSTEEICELLAEYDITGTIVNWYDYNQNKLYKSGDYVLFNGKYWSVPSKYETK